jgi:hypothetical protein
MPGTAGVDFGNHTLLDWCLPACSARCRARGIQGIALAFLVRWSSQYLGG